jgi:hypothetical protein
LLHGLFHFWLSYATTATSAIPFPFPPHVTYRPVHPSKIFVPAFLLVPRELLVATLFWCQSFTYSLFLLSKIFMPAFSLARTCGVSTSLVPEHFRFSGVSTFLVPALFWCQHFSGASAFLVPALFWCQPFSGAFLVSALFWCQHFSGASAFLVPAPFWCQPFSGASPFLVPALFWCQQFSGARALPVSAGQIGIEEYQNRDPRIVYDFGHSIGEIRCI